MNKTGIQSGEFYTDDNFEWGMQAIKQAGFDCIDFNIDNKINVGKIAEGEEDTFFTQSDEELKEYYRPQKEMFEFLGLTMSQMHGPFPVYIPDNKAATDVLFNATVKSLMLCEYFGCPYLVVHPYTGSSAQEDREINMYIYKRLIPAAKKYGVGICLENMFKSKDGHIYEGVCSDITQACEFIDELNEFAGEKLFSFCYDLGHATLLGKNIKRSLVQLGDRLTVLHIHDNDGVGDIHMQPYSHTRGRGFVTDWDGFIEGLREIGFKGVLSFETFNSVRFLPGELKPAMANFIAAVGRNFAERIAE